MRLTYNAKWVDAPCGEVWSAIMADLRTLLASHTAQAERLQAFTEKVFAGEKHTTDQAVTIASQAEEINHYRNNGHQQALRARDAEREVSTLTTKLSESEAREGALREAAERVELMSSNAVFNLSQNNARGMDNAEALRTFKHFAEITSAALTHKGRGLGR
jgi:hypothetical protein